MERILFIYNPNAGKGSMRQRLSEVIEIFMKAGFEVTVYATMSSQDATNIVVEKGKNYNRVICAGGDGTLHEVVEGLMSLSIEERPKCGYIPTGTVNDFATSIKLPKRILKAAEVAAGSMCRAYDIGDLNGDHFTYVAAFGAFTAVSYETPQSAKNLLGKTAYVLDGMSKIGSVKSVWAKVTTDDEQWEEDCVLGMITNTKTIGGFNLYRKNKVYLDDGYLDGIFVKNPKNPIELNQVMNYLLTGEDNSQIRRIHSKKIVIETKEDVAYTLDGENGGQYKKAVITNHKQAITYFHS